MTVPLYTNIPYPFQADPPRVMGDTPAQLHELREPQSGRQLSPHVRVARQLAGTQVFLQFDGVDSAFYVWVNGQQVGYSEDSRTPALFNITKYMSSPGVNDVAVEVYRYSDGSYLEDQDYWRLSGIYRDVFLWSAADLHIRDFFVRTDLDSDYRDATLEVEIDAVNLSAPGRWGTCRPVAARRTAAGRGRIRTRRVLSRRQQTSPLRSAVI